MFWAITNNQLLVLHKCTMSIFFIGPHEQLIVGARDALFRLSLDGLTKLEMADWPATSSTVGLCTAKGQSETYCRNYIKESQKFNLN